MPTADKSFKTRPKKESFWIFIRKEKFKTIIEITTTTIGVLLALFINTLVDNYNKKQTFDTMVEAIKYEAKQNEVILINSYWKYCCQGGMVLQEFSQEVVKQYWTQPGFVEFASDSQMKLLTNYILNIKLANQYRLKAIEYLEKQDESAYENVVRVWEPNLTNCDFSIKKVIYQF